MLEKVITKCPKRLFHLSEENHDGEYFKPRVPDSIIDSGEYKEDDKVRRVCFANSKSGAYFAINFRGGYEKLYVHVPENIEDIVRRRKLCKPSKEQVYDVDYCGEYWVKCKVKLKCIGYIKIGYNLQYYYRYNKPKVHFKYIERYT